MRLKNKVALVTGSSSGIGKEIALNFAKEGANIIVNYHTRFESAQEVAKKIRQMGRKAIVIKADVSNLDEVANMVNIGWEKYGKIDILVNNSGITRKCSIIDTKLEQWNEVLNVNLTGVYLCSRIVAKKMIQNCIHGKIINISSINSYQVEINRGSYNTSKGGINSLTRSLAVELGPYHINVNAIAFGNIAGTNIDSEFLKDKDVVAEIINRTPLRYIGTVEDSVGPTLFLATEDSKYIQGEIIVVDGGMTILQFG